MNGRTVYADRSLVLTHVANIYDWDVTYNRLFLHLPCRLNYIFSENSI